MRKWGSKPTGYWKSVAASFTAGLLLAASLFLINDAILVTQEINGMWTCEITVVETNYQPYRGMITGHIVVLHGDRTNVRGSVERIWEKTVTGPIKQYSSEGILEGSVDGYHEDRLVFFRKRDRLQLMVQFHGEIRNPTFYLDTEELSNESISGKYVSTVAQSESGSFECNRPG